MAANVTGTVMTFDDEFNTFSGSPTGAGATWKTTYAFNNRTLTSNNEQEYYSDSSVGVDPFADSNGILTITAAPGSNPLGLPYDSGAINTQASFSQTYGYFEMRAQLPSGDGLWPAFWLGPENNVWPPELDVVEMYGNPTKIYVTSHATLSSQVSIGVNVPNASLGYHTYAVFWTPTTITWYFDGAAIATTATPADMDTPMYMIANLAVDSDVDSTTPFPAQMNIDYIRAYAYTGAPPVTLSIAAPAQLSVAPRQAITIAGIDVGDPAAVSGDTVTVTLSDRVGKLAAPVVGGVTAKGGGTTSLTLSGGFAAVNTALAGLTYTASSATSVIDSLAISASDSEGGSATAAVPVVASSVPVLLGASGDPAATVLTPTPITGISLTDGSATASEIFTVVLTHTAGTLTTPALSGLTQTATSSVLTLSGTLSVVNLGLAGLIYTPGIPPGNASAVQTIGVTATDALGDSTTASLAVSVTVPPDVPPVLTLPTGVSGLTGTAVAVTGLRFTDTDLISAGGSFKLVLTAGQGTLATHATAGVTSSGEASASLTLTGAMAALDSALATLTYTATPGIEASDTLGLTITDTRGGTAAGTIPVSISGPILVTGWSETVTRGNGTFQITGSGSGATITLGNGNQSVVLTGWGNTVTTGSGNQTITLAGNSNIVTTGAGTSTINAGVSYAHVTIGATPAGTTTIIATGYADVIGATGAGNVDISGTLGQAVVTLGNGNDDIVLGGAQNSITVGTGTTTISAGTGQEVIHAGGGADTITVSGWNNLLDAGPGSNLLNGGNGDDTFELNGAGQGLDTISNFVVNSDLLDLQRTLSASAIGVTAATVGRYVTSTNSGGNTLLFVDPTGGSASPSEFAVLKGVTTSVAELLAGKEITGLDPGTASISGEVFSDANADGVLDGNERGLAGVTVTLLTSTGAATGYATTTASGGGYSFTGLGAGSYVVVFTAPAGEVFDPQAKSGNPAVDSSANPATGRTAAMTVAIGQAVTNVNAGLTSGSGTITGEVFLDANRDGKLDGTEAGVAGVTVQLLTGAGAATGTSTTTNSSGAYSFTGLLPGSYEVKFAAPTGDSFDAQNVGGVAATESSPAPTTGITAAIAVAAGQTVQNVNAGLLPAPGTITGEVFLDTNGDGKLDGTEAGVADVTVQLLTGAGAATGTSTTTNASGVYSFTGLAAGSYEVKFVAPTGDTFDAQNVSGIAATESSPAPATGITAAIAVAAGQTVPNVNAGLLPAPGTITGEVFLDTNGDGKLDGTEAGLAGVTVQLLTGAGAATGTSTTTNTSGAYSFTGLLPGSYEIAFTAPTGDTFDAQNVGGVAATESSPAPTTGITAAIAVAAGQTVPNVNAGLLPAPGTITGEVFLDTNGDGKLDGTEAGLAGVTVQLLTGAGAATGTSTTTNASGAYSFTGLLPGSYEVEFTAPTGDSFDAQNVGGVAATESSPAPTTGITAAIAVAAGQTVQNVNAGLMAPVVAPVGTVPTPIVITGWGQKVTQGNGTYSVTGAGSGAFVTLGNGNQSFDLTGWGNTIALGDGNQTIILAGNNNVVTTGSGTSTINLGVSDSDLTIGATPTGTTTITASGYSDVITATGAGNVAISGTLGQASVTVQNGNDTITLGGSQNSITTGIGTTTIDAGTGQSVVHAGGGADTITVGGWNNLLDAGPGSNVLNGGNGNDTFMLNGAGQGLDRINNFVTGSDVLDLTRTVAGLGVASDMSNLGKFVTSTISAGNTTLLVDPTGGHGTPGAFAVLDGIVTTIATLVAAHRVTT
jgi:beta-glucanase (GH16 family)/uncharacterized protein (DUF2141 family)